MSSGSKCEELSLNHHIYIQQIKEQFVPLQSKKFIRQHVTHGSSSTSRITYIDTQTCVRKCI